MKFTCDRSALVDKLSVLARGVSTRSALPVLSGILLQANEGRLDLFATDMELSIKANLTTPVERDGLTVYELRLHPEDVGKIIGRHGVTINAIRSLLLAGSAKKGVRCSVEIVEDNKPAG